MRQPLRAPDATLRLGGKTWILPVTAVPYLGRGLDPGLLEPSQPGGRLAVRVTYSRTVPTLPGGEDHFRRPLNRGGPPPSAVTWAGRQDCPPLKEISR
jgi:hypothetical protein